MGAGLRLRVLKFGGTSVATPEARRAAATRVVQCRESGAWPIVVVSAIGRRGMPYATDTLIATLKEIDADTTPEPRELDLMMACGEMLSAAMFAHLLKAMGVPAAAMTGAQAGIYTDGVHGDARIASLSPERIHAYVKEGLVPVVCGFQGISPATGAITTLGRGGSDTTAAALGAALDADRIEIFTDVPGILTADPRIVGSAKLLRQVAYGEVAELAHLGAKVLHPRAAEIAMRANIPMAVRSTFSDALGTEIVNDPSLAKHGITGVTASPRLGYFKTCVQHGPLAQGILAALAAGGFPIMALAVSPAEIAFAVPTTHIDTARNSLDGVCLDPSEKVVLQVGKKPTTRVRSQMAALGKATLTQEIELKENCALVSVIGREGHQRPGVFAEALLALSYASIEPLQTVDSEYSVGFILADADVDRAVIALHDAFAGGEA